MQIITSYIQALFQLMLDMSAWLLFGFLVAGILHVFFSEGKLSKLLGGSNLKSVFWAAMIGVPLPLCSCGVIPTGISIHKNGASKGAAISFLISTPQTGIDSILVTYSLLGLPFAIVRPIVAFVTGMLGGIITNNFGTQKTLAHKLKDVPKIITNEKKENRFLSIFRYAFVEFMEDIAKWLVIGLLLAALIAVLVPNDFFAQYISNDFLGMLIILVVSIPLYVCATSSVPIAAVLLMKGISPGAALVFLMAGPATNAATISVIGNALGKRTLFLYLGTLIFGALASGLFIDNFLPREWFTASMHNIHSAHNHGELLPYWLQLFSAITITLLLCNIFVRKIIKKIKGRRELLKSNSLAMNEIKVFVRGMTCNHCKMNVENNLKKLEGIDNSVANLETETVTITGESINLDKIKEVVESIGYRYDGKL